MDTTPFRPAIRSQADLERTWRALIEPLGFSRRSLWVMLIASDDRPLPRLVEISDLPPGPDAGDAPRFESFLARLRADGYPAERVAFLLARPGRDRARDDDRYWAETLYDVSRSAGVPCETVHLATDDEIWALPMDELGIPRPA